MYEQKFSANRSVRKGSHSPTRLIVYLSQRHEALDAVGLRGDVRRCVALFAAYCGKGHAEVGKGVEDRSAVVESCKVRGRLTLEARRAKIHIEILGGTVGAEVGRGGRAGGSGRRVGQEDGQSVVSGFGGR